MNVEHEITAIKERNAKVEADKAWEVSITRKIFLTLLIYFIITLLLFSIGVINPLLNAIIPTVGFFLSTLSLPFVKGWWIKYWYKK